MLGLVSLIVIWDNTLWDPQIIVLGLGILCVTYSEVVVLTEKPKLHVLFFLRFSWKEPYNNQKMKYEIAHIPLFLYLENASLKTN